MASENNASAKAEDESANIGMRNQFYGTMQSILSSVDLTDAPARILALHKEASQLLSATEDNRRWNDAYRAEKILAHLRPVSSLRFELKTQIGFLKKMGHEGWETYDAQFKQLFKSELKELPEFDSVPIVAVDDPVNANSERKDAVVDDTIVGDSVVDDAVTDDTISGDTVTDDIVPRENK